MATARVSEFGRKWDARVPRFEVSRYVARLHVSTAFAEIEAKLSAQMDGKPGFTAGIRRQTIEYARICHERNRDLYRRVMRG